jgi:glutamate-1-semialdehyde 2,1-aminomutase
VQPGIGNPRPVREVYTLKEGDETTLRVLTMRRDIACVLVNPLQALHPNAAAPSDSTLVASDRKAHFDRASYVRWLEALRAVCTKRGIALIFDEVFLGFRLARGGAQEYFGVSADLVTYGKTVGGGLPIGVVCGKRAWMRRFREDRPTDICFARGTFNSHPLVMATMNEFLRYIDSDEGRAGYRDLDSIWNRRARALNARLEGAGLPLRVANLLSVWTTLFTQPSRYNWMLQYYLRAEGLALPWIGSARFLFSHATTDAEFQEVLERIVAAALAMQSDGWWWHNEALDDRAIKRRILRELLRAALTAQ